MELDFDRYCFLDSSPTTVLPSPRQRSKVSDRKSSGKLVYRNQCSTVSCKDFQFDAEANEPLAFQSFKEVSLGREKIDFSRGTRSALSFGIIDSLCSSDEDSSRVDQKRPSSVMSLSEPSENQLERNCNANLQKPLSMLLTLSHSPAKLESNGSFSSSSPKSQFSSVRKFLGPFAKSMPHRSPLSGFNDAIDHDIFENYQEEMRMACDLVGQNCPAHLHGLLKFRNKHRVPFFEFLVDSTQDVYVTKACKVQNAVDSIYTFHSFHHGRNAHASGRGFKGRYRELSSTVGQMQISCRMCRKFDSNGEANISLVTEFVLHDILHSRKSSSSQDHSSCSPDYNNEISGAGSHSELEIGAVITQVPFPDSTGQLKDIYVHSHPPKTHVLIPAGSHASPTIGSHGPSPLLDRWRSGGGCDCGGWDAACPLIVFSNQNVMMDSRNLVELFVQGKKENTPAFAMRAIEHGKYAVDFHAQLTSLQAFFICIAVLHTTEGSFRRVFAENKIINTTDDAKCEVNNDKMEELLPSFVVNPPFSPVARV